MPRRRFSTVCGTLRVVKIEAEGPGPALIVKNSSTRITFLAPPTSTSSPYEAMIVKRGTKYSTAMVISAQPTCSHRQELLSSRASSGSRRNFRTDAHACACAMLLSVGQLDGSAHRSNCDLALRRWGWNSCIARRLAKSLL